MDWPNVNRVASRMQASAAVELIAGDGYQTIFASLPFHTCQVLVTVLEVGGGTILDWLVDLAMGASVPIATSLLYSERSGSTLDATFDFPLGLPAGQSLIARANSTSGASSIFLAVTVIAGAWDHRTTSRILTVGDDIAGVGGTGITPGNNAKGSYAELTAALASPIRGFCFALGTQADNAAANRTFLLDLAVGAGGSEVVIVPNVCCAHSTNEQHPFYVSPWLDIAIPAGTRIAASMATGGDPIGDVGDIVLYGGVS